MGNNVAHNGQQAPAKGHTAVNSKRQLSLYVAELIEKIKLPFRKDRELCLALHEVLGFYPRHVEHYKQALMHKSLREKNDHGRPLNNERLEFLGDAILDAIVGDIVYRHFENKREGFLTNTRSKIVQRETLNRLAVEIGVSRLIKTNNQSTTHNCNMDGNAFEALVGAIYLDQGYNACMRFMEQRILGQMLNIDKLAYKEMNFKSKLLEWAQKNKVKLEYRLVEERRDAKNNPVFTYMAVLNGVDGYKGTGYSKKESQQTASRATLQNIKKKGRFYNAVLATANK